MIKFEETWSDTPYAVIDGSKFTMKVFRDRNLWHCSVTINCRKLTVSSAKRLKLFNKLEKSIKSIKSVGGFAPATVTPSPAPAYRQSIFPNFRKLADAILPPEKSSKGIALKIPANGSNGKKYYQSSTSVPRPVESCLREVVNDVA